MDQSREDNGSWLTAKDCWAAISVNGKLRVALFRLYDNPAVAALAPENWIAVKSPLDLTRLAELDRQFHEFAQLQHHAVPLCGWAKTIRLALGMSSLTLGGRLGISGQGVRKLEQAEVDGSISLKTLSRLAHGLNCEVRYMLVPRTSLVDQVLTRAQERAGNAQPTSPQTWALAKDTEVFANLSKLLAQTNRRGFW